MDSGAPAVPSLERNRKKFYQIFFYSVDLWTFYLNLRQLEFLWWNGQIPPVLEGVMTPNEYVVSRAQSMFVVFLGTLNTLARLYSRTQIIVDRFPSKMWASTKRYSQDDNARVLIYVALDDIRNKCVVIPLAIILSMTNKGLKVDPWSIVQAAIFWLLASAGLAVLRTTFIMRETQRNGTIFFIYSGVIIEAVTLIGHAVFIGILAPWMLTRLPDGPAKSNIDGVTKRVGYSPNRIYLDTNESADPNAYHAGVFGASMIVVTNNLLNVVGPSDIAAVIAHELGHWAYGHSYCGFTASVVSSVCLMYAACWAYGNQEIYDLFSFDPSDVPPPIMGVLLFSNYIFPSISGLIVGLRGSVSILCEYAADGFAVGMGLRQELRSSLINLVGKLKNFPGVDPWFAGWFRGHPSMLTRIEVLSS